MFYKVVVEGLRLDQVEVFIFKDFFIGYIEYLYEEGPIVWFFSFPRYKFLYHQGLQNHNILILLIFLYLLATTPL